VGPGRLPELLYALGLEALLEGEDDAPEELQQLAAERDEARAARDFARADELRDRLTEAGWEIRDTPEGARLVRRS
jgi:cysteinyl-tRNA synthetase